MTKPDELMYEFSVLQSFRLGGRTYQPGDVLNRRHLAIGHRVIRELLNAGTSAVA
jgi:hypothetical protein